MQAYRTYLRALPYLASLAAVVYYFRRPTGEPVHAERPSGWSSRSGILVLNLLHSTTHSAGRAGAGGVPAEHRCAGPVDDARGSHEAKLTRAALDSVRDERASSVVGVLQVYYPEQFLPPEFSALGLEMNPDLVSSLTYRGADGQEIVRPPGLSDMPGGAAVAAMLTMALGVVMAFRQRRRWSCARLCLSCGRRSA